MICVASWCTVLELGAGSALCSLLAARMGASHVEITDYPSQAIFDAIRKNVTTNLTEDEKVHVQVSGLDWTDEVALEDMAKQYPEGFTRCVLLSQYRSVPSSADHVLKTSPHYVHRILAADTLWMGHLNTSQIKVMTTLLSRSSSDARIYIVAGLHTGRHVIRSFLDECVAQGLAIEQAMEIDRLEHGDVKGLDWKRIVEENVDQETIYEGIEEERRRWLVFASLKWA